MSVKVYTQANVDAILPDEDGVRNFPTGDYSAIIKFDDQCEFEGFCVFGESCKFGGDSIFGEGCGFAEGCKFGEECEFGARCRFGEDCKFGSHCIFGEGSIFGGYCSFGNICIFGEGCSFGQRCAFNHWCKVDARCKFGEKCRFSTDCIFGTDCTFENGFKAKTTLPFLALVGVGSEARTCYFYDFQEGIHVRAGCFFGSLEEFKAKVLEDEETPETPSKKTKNYLAFCSIAETQFN